MLQICLLALLSWRQVPRDAFISLENRLYRGQDSAAPCSCTPQVLELNSFWVTELEGPRGVPRERLIWLAAKTSIKNFRDLSTNLVLEDALFNVLTAPLLSDLRCDGTENILQKELPAFLQASPIANLLHPQLTHRALNSVLAVCCSARIGSSSLTVAQCLGRIWVVEISPEFHVSLRKWLSEARKHGRRTHDNQDRGSTGCC